MRFLIVVFFFTQFAHGQVAPKDEWSFQLKAKSGMLLAHRGTMGHLYKNSVIAGELSVYKRLRTKSWSETYRNPYVGFTLFGSNLGNNAVLGYGFGVYGFMEFPWFRSDRHVITSKLGAGMGGATKIYDPIKNPKNVAIASHVNALICLGIQGRWYVSKHDALVYGLDMTHFSNGSMKVPNLGVNLPYISIGYAHVFKEKEVDSLPRMHHVKTPFFKNWSFSTIGILSAKENFPSGGKKYPVYAVSGMIYKQFRAKVAMEVALDLISKQSLFGYRDYIPKTQWSIFQIGTYVGYSIPLDKFRFVIGMGYYAKDRYDADDEFYHRVGMRYQTKRGILLNLVLKSHWAKADYIEFGVGYTFKRKSNE